MEFYFSLCRYILDGQADKKERTGRSPLLIVIMLMEFRSLVGDRVLSVVEGVGVTSFVRFPGTSETPGDACRLRLTPFDEQTGSR